jgi:plasmid stability protein
MAQFIVRHLEEDVKARLKQRATHHGRSMEDEGRHILSISSAEPSQQLSAQFRVAAPSERVSEVGFVPLSGTIEISLKR